MIRLTRLKAWSDKPSDRAGWCSAALLALIVLLALTCMAGKAYAAEESAALVAAGIDPNAGSQDLEAASEDIDLEAGSSDPKAAFEDVDLLSISDTSLLSMETQATATSWTRLAGDTALDTMERIVRAGKFATGGTVVLATANGYWDALTSAGAAGMRTAPILMTDGRKLSSQTRSLLADLKPSKLVICGGPAAVSKKVASEAAAAAGGCKTVRFYGQDAVGTSVDIFKKAPGELGGSWASTVFICTSGGYWDALAAAPISYAKHIPILLTNADGTISNSVISAMKGKVKRFVIVGGTAAVPDSTKKRLTAAGFTFDRRLGGKTAIETSEAVASYGLSLGMSTDNLGVATTNSYWDALAGAALCGKRNGVMVLVSDSSSHSLKGYVKDHYGSCSTGYVFGGPAAVSNDTYATLRNYSSPETHIVTPYYSFDIPDYWDGRVTCESKAGGFPNAVGPDGKFYKPIYSTQIKYKATGDTLYCVNCYKRSEYSYDPLVADSRAVAVIYGKNYVVSIKDVTWYKLDSSYSNFNYSRTTANNISDIMTGGRIPQAGNTKYQGKNRELVDEEYIKEVVAPTVKVN